MEKFGLKPGPVIKEVKEIMLDWLDENPELGRSDWNKFEGEYGGKGLWVWKESRDIFALTLTEPVKGMDGDNNQTYEYPYTIEKGGVELKGLEGMVERDRTPKDIFRRDEIQTC